MQEVFDRQQLVDGATLEALMRRNDRASAVRLLVHLGCIGITLGWTSYAAEGVWVAAGTLVLACLTGAAFAPFHECTHGTAFATAAYNRWAAWLTGFLFGVSWRTYREFHFAHHTHTQDPARDPEIMAEPATLSPWPRSPVGWLLTVSGARMLWFKLAGLLVCWVPGPHTRFADLPWRARLDTQFISAFWILLALGAVVGIAAAQVLLAAFLLGHVAQGVWLTTEHSGCAESGSIVERTRSVRSNALVRFFLWNMNFHAEHHGWPAVPWHALPALNAHLGGQLTVQPGYVQVYRDAWRDR